MNLVRGYRQQFHVEDADIHRDLSECLYGIRVYEDAAGALWIGTEHGLARYQAGTFEAIALPDSPVAGVAQDTAGSVWIGTASQGLFEQPAKTVQRAGTG